MKILVTGGAGFIGSNFIHFILNKYKDYEIINLDALTYAGDKSSLEVWGNDSRYRFVRGDICDKNLVDSLVNECDAIVHFAAESHVDRSINDATSFIQTNIFGTFTLLESARNHGNKRFHHISTDEVFGSLGLDDRSKFNERTNYNPRSPYSASKAGSDHLVRAYYETYGLPITITNCSNNFGPYQFPEKFIPLAITNIVEGKKVPVYGDGLYVRDWLYVVDHCRAIDLVLNKGKVGETYLVGGMTKDIPNLEVVKQILKIMGVQESSIEYVKDRPGHDRRYAVDWSKIQSELGWKPEHDFEEWLEKTVQWYRENENWWKDIKTGAYQKYYQEQYGKI